MILHPSDLDPAGGSVSFDTFRPSSREDTPRLGAGARNKFVFVDHGQRPAEDADNDSFDNEFDEVDLGKA